jgi:hypothetical protein
VQQSFSLPARSSAFLRGDDVGSLRNATAGDEDIFVMVDVMRQGCGIPARDSDQAP